MKQVLVLVGPTAVGKSDYGIQIAQEMSGEIVSGDSIQVYKGFDIGSGKVTKEERDLVPHHLIDILEPTENTSVADFQRLARKAIDEIHAQGKLPILVGGTGLYIKAALYDYVFTEAIPQRVDEDLKRMNQEELYAELIRVDKEACQNIHPNNRKRVERAIMIARSGKKKSELEANQSHTPIYDVLFLGLTCPREHLYQRINRRDEIMVEKGLQNEVKTLLDSGITFSHQAMQGIGYREWQLFFEGKVSQEEVLSAIQTHSRQFAKRQYTWFNHQIPVTWLDIEEPGWQDKGKKIIQTWRNKDE